MHTVLCAGDGVLEYRTPTTLAATPTHTLPVSLLMSSIDEHSTFAPSISQAIPQPTDHTNGHQDASSGWDVLSMTGARDA